ncbi:MAG: IS701 family transposase [Verrucomicrobiota bacterium JB023]|nr:IS701 family transposase [Verrucomicrobiota bacterium JB023]
MDFCRHYEHHFVQRGMNSVEHARHYLSGLLGKQRRKNIETINNDVSSSDYQGMEQFISSSPWCYRGLMKQVARDAGRMMSCPKQTGLFIDETSFLKKGKSSVGVQRQWSGRAGKIENCQVAVFASLGDGKRMALTDFRLFLPESWAEDPARCDKAKVPENERRHRAKWELALEMIKEARANGLGFGWVGVDSLYGSNARFLNELEDLGEHFVADINKTTKVWTSEPQLEKPGPSTGGRPRKHARLHPRNAAQYVSVEELARAEFETGHRQVSYRQGTKGALTTRFMSRDVWCWERGWPRARKRRLLIRQDADGSFKWTLTSLPPEGGARRDAWLQGQRFWIEHAFHEAKSQLGMAQYQVRVWKGWHHHMALVCLAFLFTEKTRDLTRAEQPLLGARDITELLDYYLPRKNRSEAELLAQIQERHRLRQLDIDRRAKHSTGLPKNLTK